VLLEVNPDALESPDAAVISLVERSAASVAVLEPVAAAVPLVAVEELEDAELLEDVEESVLEVAVPFIFFIFEGDELAAAEFVLLESLELTIKTDSSSNGV